MRQPWSPSVILEVGPDMRVRYLSCQALHFGKAFVTLGDKISTMSIMNSLLGISVSLKTSATARMPAMRALRRRPSCSRRSTTTPCGRALACRGSGSSEPPPAAAQVDAAQPGRENNGVPRDMLGKGLWGLTHEHATGNTCPCLGDQVWTMTEADSSLYGAAKQSQDNRMTQSLQ